jgi:large subunit ribosomal protein L15
MKLNEIRDNPGSAKTSKRLGRGIGSGKGKTSGRGVKGQSARTGYSIDGFEGGQMPIYRRLPKRGFNNTVFARRFNEVSLGRVQQAIDAGKLDAKATIDAAALVKAGVIRRPLDGVRLLSDGELKAKAGFDLAGASKAAIAKVEKAGGSVKVPERPARTGKFVDKLAKRAKEKAEKIAAAIKGGDKAQPKAADKSAENAAPKGEGKAKSEAKATSKPAAKP